ncbi:MAG: GDP-4-dehydro-6-deoxy-D-mannose reductase, partial [Actinomycetota bacterium]
VGGHLITHLAESGDEIALLDSSGTDRVDITSASAVRKRIRAERPDAIYHLAALSHIGSSWGAPNKVFRVNAEGTLNVLRAASNANVDRVLVVGSADQYGRVAPEQLPITEDAPLQPMTPYGASKVAAEFVALQAFLGTGLPVVRVRAFNHTGPGQADRFVVSSIARHIAQAERDDEGELRLGSLDPIRDFTDVRDVVRAYRLLIERGVAGEVYNVCSGVGHSIADVADRMLALSERSMKLVVDPSLVRPVEVPALVGNNSRLRAATGWSPIFAFDDTLRALLDDWRARLVNEASP